MPTLSYCKSVNNCSPNLLHFKVARNEKLYFGPFFLALRFGPALHICLFILHNAHHALPCFLPTPCSAFALSAFDMSPALHCPAMSSPALSSTALSSPALPANSPISGRSDRKVLRLIYRYRHFGHFLTHFAALSVTDTKQMVTIWTSRFEDLSLNCVLG